MSRTLILPGLDGSGPDHWQSWWLGIDPTARLVDQINWKRPSPEAWEVELAGAILLHPGSILVAHSLGAVTVARILTTWPQLDVAGVLLVAPAEPVAGSRIAPFAPIPERPLPVPATVVASQNDPWMSFARAEHLAKAWGADLVDLGHAGHINVAAGFGPWPRGLALRDALVQRARPRPVSRARVARPIARG